MCVIVSLALSCSALYFQSGNCPQCSISGTVINERGAPVSGARVRVDPLEGRPRSDVVESVESDDKGHFVLADLKATTYKIFAMKESAGYPNTAFAFYSNHEFQTVSLSAAHPTANLIVKIGPRAGIIRGMVRSAATGQPVDVALLLRRASAPQNWMSISEPPNFKAQIPADTDVILEVSAPGYRTWYFGGPMDTLKRTPIRLKSDEELTLNIQLQPEEPIKKQEIM